MKCVEPGWLRGSLTDEHGEYDVAYVSLFGVTALVLGTILVMCGMSIVDWKVCKEVFRGDALIVDCRFDPDRLGNGVGKVCAAYSAALFALAGYMAATRRQPSPAPATTITTATATTATTTNPGVSP